MLSADYVVVGAGLTGATIARLLWDAGRDVAVVEKRPTVGGNVQDFVHPSGIRIHTHGPHYFRTGSDNLWAFATRFGKFYRYEAQVLSIVDGQFEHWPILKSYLDGTVGKSWVPGFSGTPRNFEEASLSVMPTIVYEKFVKGYTEKQWGTSARSLETSLARRFDIRPGDDTRLMQHKYQGLPSDGYSAWMANLLDQIPVEVNTNYLDDRSMIRHKKLLIFTGPIDEFFGFSLGRLKYRGQKREHKFLPDVEFCFPCGQVNNPDPRNGNHIRTLEWKHMLSPGEIPGVRGTVLTTETPFTPSDSDCYEYPFPDEVNRRLYQRYAALAARNDDVLICGRLGEYRYYDMDQALGKAMKIAANVLGSDSKEVCAASQRSTSRSIHSGRDRMSVRA